MHDRNGTPLRVGDIVTLEMVITQVHPGADFCNVTAQSVDGRKPDGLKESFCGNSAVLVLQRKAPCPT
jgi:hypothetical protein